MEIRIRKLWPAVAVCGSFIFGAVFGCLFAALIGGDSAQQLRKYLEDYLILAGNAGLSGSFCRSIWMYCRWLLLCVLGIVAGIGLFMIPFLALARGFLLVFGIACFVRFWGLSGFVPAGVIFGIPALFWLPGLLFVAIPGVCARSIFRHGSGSEMARTLRSGVFYSIILFFVCVFLEYSLLPSLLSAAASILGYGGVSGV